jgi:hypothetical protein
MFPSLNYLILELALEITFPLPPCKIIIDFRNDALSPSKRDRKRWKGKMGQNIFRAFLANGGKYPKMKKMPFLKLEEKRNSSIGYRPGREAGF